MPPRLLDPRPYFADLPDPHRMTQNKLHSLHDILMIVLSAVLSGIGDWVGMETFAQEREAWLRGFLELPCVFHGKLDTDSTGNWTDEVAKRRAG